MQKLFVAVVTVGSLSISVSSIAQDHGMMHQKHMMQSETSQSDTRIPVAMPTPMRQHMLTNMRDHLSAMSEILTAMSQREYAKAADISEKRLGMNSPSAAGCSDDSSPPSSSRGNMDQQMTNMMPEGMRQIGLSMHKAANDFSAEARKANKSGNDKKSLASLAKVTEQCTACHSTYKVNQ